jgi:hypothetical protein
VVSFDEALKEAVEVEPGVRKGRMVEVVKRPDARQAHPWMDHLMPVVRFFPLLSSHLWPPVVPGAVFLV